MALMNEKPRRGELEVDGGLELEGGNESICKAGSAGLCQAAGDFGSPRELRWDCRCVLRDCASHEGGTEHADGVVRGKRRGRSLPLSRVSTEPCQ